MADITILTDEQVAEIEAAANALKDVSNACDITHAKPEFIDYLLKCSPAHVLALCQTVRALRAELAKVHDERWHTSRLLTDTQSQLAAVTQERDALHAVVVDVADYGDNETPVTAQQKLSAYAHQRYVEGLRDAAQIADKWAGSHSCDTHDDNPCCHVRTGVAIADAIREQESK